MPRGTTGRAVSATIHSRLRDALLAGQPMTYAQLAAAAGCTVRSVRNYLARSREIFGFDVEQQHVPGSHAIALRAAGVHADNPPHDLARSLAHGLRQQLFHIDPAAHQGSQRPLPFVVSMRGLPSYSDEHEKLLAAWLHACVAEPRSVVRLAFADSSVSELLLWPLGAVLHNVEGIVLLGLPLDADSSDRFRAINLDTLRTGGEALALVDRKETGDPAVDLSAINPAELLDLPFSAVPRSPDARTVNVHVRFDPPTAERVRSRWWHKSQSAVLRTDGCLDLEFGPVDLGAAAAWVASYGDAVRVIGDKKLRKAVKKRDFVP